MERGGGPRGICNGKSHQSVVVALARVLEVDGELDCAVFGGPGTVFCRSQGLLVASASFGHLDGLEQAGVLWIAGIGQDFRVQLKKQGCVCVCGEPKLQRDLNFSLRS